MDSDILPMTIEIMPRDGQRYKSISTLFWRDIPAFAILTGKNGSGKTQLIELLAHHLTGTTPVGLENGEDLGVEVKISGANLQPEDIAYIPSAGEMPGDGHSGVSELRAFPQQALGAAMSNSFQSLRHDIDGTVRARRIIKRLGLNPSPTLFKQPPFSEEYIKKFSSGDEFLADRISITEGLAHVIVKHRLKSLEALESGTPGFDRDGTRLPPPPWEVVDAALETAGFPYRVIPPTETPIESAYVLKLLDVQSRYEIKPSELSSGEKVIFQIMLWLYTANKGIQFPKLLLLDEPDAHLHPSMTKQFFDVIIEILVRKFGIRVIMTTHSPSTVALAPEGAVFQMERGSHEVRKADNVSSIVSILSSGMVIVSKSTKFCFVEDEKDVDFFNAVRDVLTDSGPSADRMALKPSPSIAFIPASTGSGREKSSGGCNVVAQWVNKLNDAPLDQIFFGIMDRDHGREPSGRIKVLSRYSFENYLLDPLNIYGLLLENNTAPAVEGLQITSGDEHLIRIKDATELQSITNVVVSKFAETSSELSPGDNIRVRYTNGKEILVPSWVINHRGHDLLRIAQGSFGGSGLVNYPRLIRALRRGRLLPVELAELLGQIQTGGGQTQAA